MRKTTTAACIQPTQGGYGIQTVPGMGRTAAALASGQGVPTDLEDLGVEEAALSPARFRV